MLKKIAILMVISLASACAQVPQESITLSQDTGNIIQELKLKNERLISLLYNEKRQKLNSLIDNYAQAQLSIH